MSLHGSAAAGDFASQAHWASDFGRAKRGFVRTETGPDTGCPALW
jgi:hypothetical protein